MPALQGQGDPGALPSFCFDSDVPWLAGRGRDAEGPNVGYVATTQEQRTSGAGARGWGGALWT